MRRLIIAPLFFLACTKSNESAVNPLSPLAARGKTVYMSNCIACHNSDPSKDGSLGPALKGSSKELIEARVMRAEYPAGYTPKRNTKVMVALPQLKAELDALHAFLNQ
jgi:mono/diheme cytochrome c family protein